MYQIKPSKRYKKSLKKVRRWKKFDGKELDRVVNILATGKALPKKHRDHQLSGDMGEFRECHIKNDLLLIYKIENSILILTLIDIGDHHSLFDR
jgi:mRNA interferase YafQ